MAGIYDNTPKKMDIGAKFGSKPRTPGLFYLRTWPSSHLLHRLSRDKIFCNGIDMVGEIRWLRFEKDGFFDKNTRKREAVIEADYCE